MRLTNTLLLQSVRVNKKLCVWLFLFALTTSILFRWIPTKSGTYSLFDFFVELVQTIQIEIAYGTRNGFWLLILIPFFMLLLVFMLYCVAAFGVAWIVAACISAILILMRATTAKRLAGQRLTGQTEKTENSHSLGAEEQDQSR